MSKLPAIGLAVAVAAGGYLLLHPTTDPATPAARPVLQRADLPARLADGTTFTPLYFLDPKTALGTAPSRDGRDVRLVIRQADGTVRVLRSRSSDSGPEYGNVTLADGDLVWTESADGHRPEIFRAAVADLEPTLVTAATGDAIFYGGEHDLVVAAGQVYWAAATADGDTEIRSGALTGGPVQIRHETGTWALTGWPWIVSGGPDTPGPVQLRNLTGGPDHTVRKDGPGLLTCTPTWCRVMVDAPGGLARIDVMHPDGSDRHQVAGSDGGAAIEDATLLDRFLILGRTEANSDLTGTETLLVNDLVTGHTETISAAVASVAGRGPMVWWSTGQREEMQWHSLDLRSMIPR